MFSKDLLIKNQIKMLWTFAENVNDLPIKNHGFYGTFGLQGPLDQKF